MLLLCSLATAGLLLPVAGSTLPAAVVVLTTGTVHEIAKHVKYNLRMTYFATEAALAQAYTYTPHWHVCITDGQVLLPLKIICPEDDVLVNVYDTVRQMYNAADTEFDADEWYCPHPPILRNGN